MKYKLVFILSLIIINFLSAQLNESFSNSSFPPDGWRIINNDGGATWQRRTTNYNTEPGCAACFWNEYDITNDDWLITPRLLVTSGDTLKFNYRTVDPVQESVEVRLSFNGPRITDFTRVLWARRINNTSYAQAKISLNAYIDSTVYIAFRYRVQYPLQPIGVGVYVDDVIGPSIYQSHDAGVTQILTPIGNNFDSIITPSVKVKNFGSYLETIPVVFKIDGTSYEQLDSTIILPGTDTIVYFSPCTLSSGSYNSISYTILTNDDDRSNDTCQSSFIIRTSNVWQTLTPFPKIVKTTGTSLCFDDDNHIYCLRASDSSFYAYNLTSGNWEHKRGMPIKPKSGLGLVYGGNDTIYVMTCNKKAFYKYSIATNNWSLAETLPVKPKSSTGICRAGDFIYCLPRDSFFYQYSIPLNTWQRLPGIPVKLKSGSGLTADTLDHLFALQGTKYNFYAYDIPTNAWMKFDSIPIKLKKGAGMTSDGYNVYCLASGKTRKFFKRSPGDYWREVESVPSKVNGGSAITYAQGKIYCLHGTKTTDFWRYIPEPSKHSMLNIKTENKTRFTQHDKIQFPQSVIIYNASGKLVKRFFAISEPDFSSATKLLPSGIYFVHLTNTNNSTSRQIKIMSIK